MHSLIQLLSLVSLILLTSCQLKQVISAFRHAARYHLNTYYDGNSTLPVWGQLTAVGMRQHQNLGKFMRQDYINKIPFLSPTYVEGEFEVYTTDVNRTFESVTSQLYGLYGLGQGQKLLNVDPSYHLPPYSNSTDSIESTFALPEGYRQHIIPINPDILLNLCPNLDKEYIKNVNLQLETYRQMYITYFPFLKKIAQNFDIVVEDFDFFELQRLYDTLTVDLYLGRPLPNDKISEQDYLNLKHLHQWFNFLKIDFNISRAINTGKIKKILTDFDDRINNSDKFSKWSFLSTHDTDLTALMNALNISSSQCIQELYRKGFTSALNCNPSFDFASNLIFQLHTDDRGNSYYVKVRHNGEYVYLCEKRQVICDYKEWKSRVESIFIDVDRVCNGPGSGQ